MNQENIDTCIHCIHSEKENIFSLLEFPRSSSSLHIFPEEIMKKGLKGSESPQSLQKCHPKQWR